MNDRATIYASRSLDYESGVVYPILTDLGMAVLGSAEYSHAVQAIPYRGPEVILGMKWNESVDIWNLGVVASRKNELCRLKLTTYRYGASLRRTTVW